MNHDSPLRNQQGVVGLVLLALVVMAMIGFVAVHVYHVRSQTTTVTAH